MFYFFGTKSLKPGVCLALQHILTQTKVTFLELNSHMWVVADGLGSPGLGNRTESKLI